MKRSAVAVVGGLLTLTGIALLVLPGPGFVLVAAGLAVLATQFAWAKRPLDYATNKAHQGMDEVARSRLRAVGTALFAAGLMAIGIADMTDLDIPFVNVLSAIFMIASGLFLVGTIVYARRSDRYPRDRSSVR
ncbi:MAG TPA: PGPGW domain-containing protein [Actinomycetes bacterium]|nr:PGPGW domain-containing protein [Actinomycetes bacterium]